MFGRFLPSRWQQNTVEGKWQYYLGCKKGQKSSINVSVPAFGNEGDGILLSDDEVYYQPSLFLME